MIAQPNERDEALRRLAELNGCRPFWHAPLRRYHCGCEDELHFADQQSSAISRRSALRRREGWEWQHLPGGLTKS